MNQKDDCSMENCATINSGSLEISWKRQKLNLLQIPPKFPHASENFVGMTGFKTSEGKCGALRLRSVTRPHLP